MSARKASRAIWRHHLNTINPPSQLRKWLTLQDSLTTHLQSLSHHFYVERIKQRKEICLEDDFESIGLHRPCVTPVREVLLFSDGQPVVFAHTAIEMRAVARNWPMLKKLGSRSLGSLLFGDPKVKKGAPQFARLTPSHVLVKRIFAVLPEQSRNAAFYARRCLYQRNRGAMLVTEIFLPEITQFRTRLTA